MKRMPFLLALAPFVFLLLLNIFGHFRLYILPPPKITKESFERLPVYSIDDMLKYAGANFARDDPKITAYKIYDVVKKRFYHDSKETVYDPSADWFFWLGSKLNGAKMEIYDIPLLLRTSYSAQCGQQAQVMADACVTAGLEARVYKFIGERFGSHVVCEVFYDGSWHMYDPDLEVFTALSAAELHLHPDVIENLYANNHGDTPLEYFLDCCASPFDDLIWSGNAGGRQPRYFMHWYKWGIPLASMMLLTVYTLLRTKNCSG